MYRKDFHRTGLSVCTTLIIDVIKITIKAELINENLTTNMNIFKMLFKSIPCNFSAVMRVIVYKDVYMNFAAACKVEENLFSSDEVIPD